MSELIQKTDNRVTIRWKLLTSASALALMVSSIGVAHAEDADHPLVWIELGGQAENISGQGESFVPAFFSNFTNSSTSQTTPSCVLYYGLKFCPLHVTGPSILQEKITPLQAQRPQLFSVGEEAKISYQPEDSDWVFDASVRFGRSGGKRHVDHQTNEIHYYTYISHIPFRQKTGQARLFTQEKFANTHVYRDENHSIIDFMAGKDVGLGLFGRDTETVLSAGIRFAQFVSRSSVDIRARPDLNFIHYTYTNRPRSSNLGAFYHSYHAYEKASRKFHGVGPSLSWSGTTPFAGNPQNGELALDWGANAAILFGRQKSTAEHYQTGRYWSKYSLGFYSRAKPITPTAGGHTTDKSVIVPNAGGFAGLSFRYSDATISLGYRADFFFGALDGGIDARKKETLGFKGPYAGVSIGVGN